MAIVELFSEAEKAAAEVKTSQLAMETAQKDHESVLVEAQKAYDKLVAESNAKVDIATKAYADAVNKMQGLRSKIDEALGGILNTGSSVRNYS